MTVTTANPLAFNAKFHQAWPEQQGKGSFRKVTVGNASPLQRSASMSDLRAPDKSVPRSPQGNMSGTFQGGGSTESVDSGLDLDVNAPDGFSHGMGEHPGTDNSGVGRADYLEQLKRAHPLDRGAQSGLYQLQHGEDIEKVLAPVLQRWDTEQPAMNEPLDKTAALTSDTLPSEAQTPPSLVTREQCARDILKDLGVPCSRINELLVRQASSLGGTAVIDACRLLAMPEVKADRLACRGLEKKLDNYLDAAKGDYSGVSRAFACDAFSQLSELKSTIKKTFDTIGRATVQDRLLADETPALQAAVAKKNPGLPPEVLRRSLADLINAQGFSALTKRLEGADASGLLQDTALLPQLAQAADNPKRPPAEKAAEPVKDFVKHLRDVLTAIPMPTIHNDNSARNIVNQDGWYFQGIKDPRPNKAVELVSPPTPACPEVDALEPQPLEQNVEVDENIVASSDAPVGQAVDIEDDAQLREDNPPPPPPPPHSSGLHGASVHPLHGNLMEDLKRNPRYMAAQQVVTVQPPSPQVISEVQNETDEEKNRSTRPVGSTGQRERTSPLTRLAGPIPLGQHASDLRNEKRDAGT
ncbi:hypothetical protein [Stenotrophomonas sp. CFBP 13718]|uniref:hypothetical protein n=1 Tax=Stenotrophomonas sp. CFBP 13718 TaxID=2775304 RepID=UPI001785A5F9|nr:hypothetical protein [Stenotrophomonas sp. CFBP 13718]MBD8697303.1 hypothetical protein [Stenotrophomonas sp. CFBP 13718]